MSALKGIKQTKEHIEKRVNTRKERGNFKHSEETKRKIGLISKGRNMSEEQKNKISLKLKGHSTSNITKEKISKALTGRKGHPISEEQRKKLSLALKGKKPKNFELFFSKRNIFQKGHGMNKGEKNPAFNNWSSREPYTKEWSIELRYEIRKRDNYTCQECGINETQLGSKLNVHHIDFNKKNCNPNNLICLCDKCHCKTKFNRQNWIKYFQTRLVRLS